MVNKALLLIGDEPRTEVRFHTSIHGTLFNVLLVDFLSQTERGAPVKKESYLQALHGICEAPAFDCSSSIHELRRSTETFRSWLTQEIVIHNLWLPTLSLDISLRIQRVDVLKIAGNVCKHNFLRSVQTIRGLAEIFRNNGSPLDEDMALLAMDEIHEWFHQHKFYAYSNAVAEFMNNIRWGIYEYLQPEFQRSYTPASDGSVTYSYIYPSTINSEFAKSCYWSLMNEVRMRPYLHRFEVPAFFKERIDEH